MSHYYFAYGSNMNPQRMRDRGLSFSQVMAGKLPGYRLVFNKRAADVPERAYANIYQAPAQLVEGVLYCLSDHVEITKMDFFEGTPRFYSREIFSIETQSGPVAAWVYVANPAVIAENLLPDRWYLEHLLAGEAYLSSAYLQQLQQVICRDDQCLSQARG